MPTGLRLRLSEDNTRTVADKWGHRRIAKAIPPHGKAGANCAWQAELGIVPGIISPDPFDTPRHRGHTRANEIAAITGHSLKHVARILEVYPSRTRHLADAAIFKLEKRLRKTH